MVVWYLRGEESGQDVANETANTMHGKDIKSVVASKEVLQLGSIVARDTSADAEDDRSPGWHEARTGRNGDEAGNDTGAETDS